MPRIFDNLTPQSSLQPALQTTLERASRADFCVGYFNLRGWSGLASYVDKWPEHSGACRLLIGMHSSPHDELRKALSFRDGSRRVDNQIAHRRKLQLAEELRSQLTIGTPTNADERTLRKLARQLRAKKVRVKLFLRHPLHAKLYLLSRDDPDSPAVAYVGSSNLTLAGLSRQGELNVDVLDHDATRKLQAWFDDRWNDPYSTDLTDELAEIIDESWARESLVPPYHVYLKIAYHLSHEARAGLSEFRIPSVFGNRLFDFQAAAVKIAAHYVNKRNGVLIGDVVGLGKTLMASALIRIFEDDLGLETLIICPKNLVPMWEDYKYRYQLRAQVLSLSLVQRELPKLPRYRLVVIDESHNLRNREGKRYRAVQEYVRANESKCVLLSATPYNKTYLDLSNQLRIFVEDDKDLGIRPERLLREIGEVEFNRRHQASPRTLAAFDHSEHADDWRDLMRLYLVRRTRSFIQDHYAETDPATGRRFLTFEDGSPSFFPARVPKTVKFVIDESDPDDQYANLYSQRIVDTVNDLSLPRYGLGNYLVRRPSPPPSETEKAHIQDLSRAGRRLMGFCRTNLFKRLESSGYAFMQSLESHVLRNYVFLHAIQHGEPIPLGPQDAEVLDTRFNDEDEDRQQALDGDWISERGPRRVPTSSELAEQAAEVYQNYRGRHERRFKWLRSELFTESLEKELQADADELLRILQTHGPWDPGRDAKLEALHALLTQRYQRQKVLVFSQFADTVRYLEAELGRRGVRALAGVTGNSGDPTELAARFSPKSNPRRIELQPGEELRILVTTDLLSEGQNLQDCHIVVNYDLPWAIIRLIQRAGRVDRIGQAAERILCHSFLPAEGVERIIDLRKRVRTRLKENAEVVGADEAFFEDEQGDHAVVDLYHEHAGTLDDDIDGEVDLASHAYEIWKSATQGRRQLEREVVSLPNVVLSSREHLPSRERPEGVLVFMRTAEDNDALAYVDRRGRSITESQIEVLRSAECQPNTPAQPRHEVHHDLVAQGIQHVVREEKRVGGQLGRPSGARFRIYNRLSQYADAIPGQIFEQPLRKAIDQIYRYPLRQAATDRLNRQLRSGADDQQLTNVVVSLYQEDQLCVTDHNEVETKEPQIICSLGLFSAEGEP